jgi:hypothetical protein
VVLVVLEFELRTVFARQVLYHLSDSHSKENVAYYFTLVAKSKVSKNFFKKHNYTQTLQWYVCICKYVWICIEKIQKDSYYSYPEEWGRNNGTGKEKERRGSLLLYFIYISVL